MYFQEIEATCLNDEDTPWIQFGLSDDVQLKFFNINPVKGEWIALAKNKPNVVLPKHYHTGKVIVYTIAGRWKYDEHDWVAGPGSVVYEVSASMHRPIIMDEEVIALNIVEGESFFYNDDGSQAGTMNWKVAMDTYLEACRAKGIKPRDLTTFSKSAFSR